MQSAWRLAWSRRRFRRPRDERRAIESLPPLVLVNENVEAEVIEDTGTDDVHRLMHRISTTTSDEWQHRATTWTR